MYTIKLIRFVFHSAKKFYKKKKICLETTTATATTHRRMCGGLDKAQKLTPPQQRKVPHKHHQVDPNDNEPNHFTMHQVPKANRKKRQNNIHSEKKAKNERWLREY